MQHSKSFEPEKWVDNYSDALFAYTLKRIGNNVEQAEDIVQETFLSAWKSKASFNGTASEKTWLYVICKNKIIDYYRKESNKKHESLEANQEDNMYFVEDGHFNNNYKPENDVSFNVTDLLQQKEFFKVLYTCKQKLKEIQEKVFSMKYLEQIEADEICNLLGITTQNYWVLMHRAKLQLRTCLEKNWINN
ncbi:MAG: sigma-70 family RNA polymerase sigma factor [Chitinophagaceae bacterium]